jgi:OOP family OmpA-OmpF porin
MRTVSIFALAALGAAAAPAAAQDYGQDTGPYVGLQAGLLVPEDIRVGDPVDTWVVLDKGFDGGAFVGYDFGMFRLEAEFVAQHAKVDPERHAARNGIAAADELIGGDQRVLAGMANAMVDFGSPDGLNFYAGGGVGYAWHRAEFWDDDNLPSDPLFPTVKDTDDAFAWQLIAGVRYPLSRKADLGLKYRYFNAGRFNYDGDLAGETARWRTHSVLATLSFNFGRSAPVEELPPPPPPPPPPVYEPAPPPPPPVYEPAPPPPPVRPGERG